MLRQPFCSTLLLFPAKASRRVLSELYIVRRISVYEILGTKLQLLEIGIRELILSKGLLIFGEIATIVDLLIATERNVE